MNIVHMIIDLDGSAHYVTQAGLLFTYGDKSVAAAPTLLADAAKIPDFGRDLKRPAAIRARLNHLGYLTETRYDAAHGRRYGLIAYHGRRERRVAMAAMDGITNLREHHLDAGVLATEIADMQLD